MKDLPNTAAATALTPRMVAVAIAVEGGCGRKQEENKIQWQ
jgi:hypothetical protein